MQSPCDRVGALALNMSCQYIYPSGGMEYLRLIFHLLARAEGVVVVGAVEVKIGAVGLEPSTRKLSF